MSTKPKQTDDEIDLGSLFLIIGRGFSKFFNFIGSIFKGLFDFLIQILLFLKSNIIKIAIATIVGAIAGTFLEFQKETSYGADMSVIPNFKSARQLYNNISYYDDLVEQKDTLMLAKTFNISVAEAKSLKGFDISPVRTENDILTSYDDLILSVDTLTVKSYSFARFKAVFTDYDYKVHTINVKSNKNDVFSKLGDVIISAVTENNYFNKVKELTNEDLNRSDSLLRNNLTQLDTLRKVYMQAIIENAKKENTGTSIDLGNSSKSAKELDLFEKNRRLNKDLSDISEDKSEKSEVINVISNFQPVGYEIKGFDNNYAFQLGLLGAISMISILLLMKLNSFLNNYKK